MLVIHKLAASFFQLRRLYISDLFLTSCNKSANDFLQLNEIDKFVATC